MMEKKEKSPLFLRQRKFYLVVPLLIIPFLTLFFWSIGGGKEVDTNSPRSHPGLNANIPDAYIKKNEKPDKMAFYSMARKDSDLQKIRIAADPYARRTLGNTDFNENIDKGEFTAGSNNYNSMGLNTTLNSRSDYQDRNEQKVYQKLNQLNYALQSQNSRPSVQDNIFKPSSTVGINSADVDRLEKMMKAVSQKDGEDPELQQINTMLEKILDVQHPDRIQEKLKEVSEKKRGKVFPVSAAANAEIADLFAADSTDKTVGIIRNAFNSTGFFSLESAPASGIQQNAITAVVHDDQVLVNGSTVKLRLTTDIYINGIHIPKDIFLFGTASLSGDRLNLSINNLQYQNSLYPVSLSAFDLDGLPGIHIPDAISRTVAKQSADQALNEFGMTNLDTSLGVQAASAGIEAARSIISKKVRLVKVTVKAGYQVLLSDGQGK